MPLNKVTLGQDIDSLTEKAAYDAALAMLEKMKEYQTETKNGKISTISVATSEEIAEEFSKVFTSEFSTNLADVIDVYIKQALITVPPGALVTTAGSAATQAGATTTPTTATIS